MLHFFKSVRYRTPVRFRTPQADTFIRTVHFPFYPPSEGRRCAEAPPPREPPAAAFSNTPHHAHLPKVSHFHAFSSHLPKVRRTITATRTACSCIFQHPTPFPPPEGESFPRIFVPPSEGAQNHHRHKNRLQPHFPPPPHHAHLPKVSSFPAFSSHLPEE